MSIPTQERANLPRKVALRNKLESFFGDVGLQDYLDGKGESLNTSARAEVWSLKEPAAFFDKVIHPLIGKTIPTYNEYGLAVRLDKVVNIWSLNDSQVKPKTKLESLLLYFPSRAKEYNEAQFKSYGESKDRKSFVKLGFYDLFATSFRAAFFARFLLGRRDVQAFQQHQPETYNSLLTAFSRRIMPSEEISHKTVRELRAYLNRARKLHEKNPTDEALPKLLADISFGASYGRTTDQIDTLLCFDALSLRGDSRFDAAREIWVRLHSKKEKRGKEVETMLLDRIRQTPLDHENIIFWDAVQRILGHLNDKNHDYLRFAGRKTVDDKEFLTVLIEKMGNSLWESRVSLGHLAAAIGGLIRDHLSPVHPQEKVIPVKQSVRLAEIALAAFMDLDPKGVRQDNVRGALLSAAGILMSQTNAHRRMGVEDLELRRMILNALKNSDEYNREHQPAGIFSDEIFGHHLLAQVSYTGVQIYPSQYVAQVTPLRLKKLDGDKMTEYIE